MMGDPAQGDLSHRQAGFVGCLFDHFEGLEVRLVPVPAIHTFVNEEYMLQLGEKCEPFSVILALTLRRVESRSCLDLFIGLAITTCEESSTNFPTIYQNHAPEQTTESELTRIKFVKVDPEFPQARQ